MIPQLLDSFGVVLSLSLLASGGVVLAIFGLLMGRQGMSLRPVAWFAGFWCIVVLPQLAYHTYDAVRQATAEAPRRAALERGSSEPGGGRQLEQLFGPDVSGALVTDVREAYGDVFANAEAARFAIFSAEETALLARFPDGRALEDAWVAYLAVSGLRDLAGGDSERGFAATSATGGRVYVLPMSTMLGVWTGPDDATIRARMAAGGFTPPSGAPLAGGDVGGEAAGVGTGSIPLAVLLAILVTLVIVATAYFFKGAAWAGGSPRAPVPPLARDELRARLLSINDLDVPFHVESPNGSELAVTWRYADARWIDFARAHGVRRTHRIVLWLDDGEHIARATDYSASFDWSAGAGRADVQWQAGLGITFFHHEHRRVLGLQVTPDGRIAPDLSYSYTFDLRDMKQPLIAAVTGAGWEWRPVVWPASPTWLRWLTE